MKELLAFWLLLLAHSPRWRRQLLLPVRLRTSRAPFFPRSCKAHQSEHERGASNVNEWRGVYSFQSLPAGRYTIVIPAPGFKTTTITDRVVETAQPAHVKLEMGSTASR